MVIRDDRGSKNPIPNAPDEFGDYVRLCPVDSYFNPDRVLHDCPTCGRPHFVTVDGCPGPMEQALEMAAVDGAVWQPE